MIYQFDIWYNHPVCEPPSGYFLVTERFGMNPVKFPRQGHTRNHDIMLLEAPEGTDAFEVAHALGDLPDIIIYLMRESPRGERLPTSREDPRDYQ